MPPDIMGIWEKIPDVSVLISPVAYGHAPFFFFPAVFLLDTPKMWLHNISFLSCFKTEVFKVT